jgi:hypothetical protein
MAPLPQECTTDWKTVEDTALDNGIETLGRKDKIETKKERPSKKAGRLFYIYIPGE